MAFDWAWEKGTGRDEREFKILQASPSRGSGPSSPTRRSATGRSSSASALMGRRRGVLVRPVPRQAAAEGRGDAVAPGRGLLGPQPRRPGHHVLDAVPRRRRAQRLHALHRRRPPRRRARPPPARRTCRAICSFCEPDESRAVACPIRLGSVTFHHGKTPHMTTANTTDSWRRILTQHLQGGRRRRRGRPLPVEGVRQPVHRRASPRRRRGDRSPGRRRASTSPPGRRRGDRCARRRRAGSRSTTPPPPSPCCCDDRSRRRHRSRQVRADRRQAGGDVRLDTGRRRSSSHSADALHGDAGMVCAGDVLLALSKSGETAEVCLRRDGRRPAASR